MNGHRRATSAEHHHHHDGRGLWARLVSFVTHSHDHTDAVDPAVDASGAGRRALGLSLAALMLTAVLQLVVMVASRSVALLADTFHNFTDALTAIPLWIAFSLGRRPPTRRFTHGYGRPRTSRAFSS